MLFMAIDDLENIEDHIIYYDLLRCFRNNGHNIYTISSYEKRLRKTEYKHENDLNMLHMLIGNIINKVRID